MRTSGMATCTAPTTTRRDGAGRPRRSRPRRPSSTVREVPASRRPARPLRRAPRRAVGSPRRAVEHAVLGHGQRLGSGGLPSPGGCGPKAGPGESAGSGVMTAMPSRPAAALMAHGRDVRLHEDVDRAAAGEADVPGLLVADAVADDPAAPGPPGALDLLERGALDAAAADRARQATVVGHEHDRALRSRRGAERAHDDGPSDVRGPRPARRPASRSAPSSRVSFWWQVSPGGRDRASAAHAARPPVQASCLVRRRRSTRPPRCRLRRSPARTPARISPSRSSEATVPAGRKSSM